MVVGEPNINNIMSGLENTGGVKQHNHRKKLKQRFDLIKKLGQGTFGKVQLGINKETGQEVAIKTIKKSKIESEADLVRIRREIQIMSSVQHPNIIHIYEVFENREKMVLVMEYAAGGELYDYLSERKVLNEEEARRIFRQIATACYYCHKHKICHRDLKLENILLDENNNAKIADFGLSNVFDDQRLLNTFCGSPLYASPEIVKGTPYHGPEVDCWSLGVLLYTLVYGAMPFDGSNFKRLVKQISQGDYFEPTKPSPASPLIREMLTVNPKHRADIEKICSHWWVNEYYEENCLEISEDLANQTPVRLDLLLSLAPPPPQLESDKLVVTEDATEDAAVKLAVASAPTRSQSVGSLMELSHPAERRIKELLKFEEKSSKRKLESTVSTDRISKKMDKIMKENTIADISLHGYKNEEKMSPEEEDETSSSLPLNKSSTQTISRDIDFEDPSLEGAACSEIIEEANSKMARLKRNLTTTLSTKLENINETPSQENLVINNNNNNINESGAVDEKPTEVKENDVKKKKIVVKKKVLTDKNDENETAKEKSKSPQPEKRDVQTNKENQEETVEIPTKPVERRRSRIFEVAEKFQNLMSTNSGVDTMQVKKNVSEKPKKIIIPGVNVDGFKKEFERKASLTNNSSVVLKQKKTNNEVAVVDPPSSSTKEEDKVIESGGGATDDRCEKVRNAVSIISSALDKEGARKSKSRPCMMRKPPVPFGVGGRSASGNIGGMLTNNLMAPVAPKPFVKPQLIEASSKEIEEGEAVEQKEHDNIDEDEKISSAEITLKSATLPRRKTSKAEIKLNYPTTTATTPTTAVKPATMEFKTEMAHPIQHHHQRPKLATQRSEVVMPIAGSQHLENRNNRASSLEPIANNNKMASRERIIPISFEKIDDPKKVKKTDQSKPSSTNRSLSRQSTQESDSSTVTSSSVFASGGEPIKKSPREYIIPIAIEGGGYVTPRGGSLEPSESSSVRTTTTTTTSGGGKPKRFSSRVSDSEEETSSSLHFPSLRRHGSFGRESEDNDDSSSCRRTTDVTGVATPSPFRHMHRLRSTRPKKSSVEHADSISSGEDDDDDDGFEILTAENLFSTLLSRVRDLTQRLNVEDGGRPGFPSSSRLLSHFDHGTNFWNMQNRFDPFSRHSTTFSKTFGRERSLENPRAYNTPWRRSVSRDLASDIDSLDHQRPRGDEETISSSSSRRKENLNLADLDLKKLNLSEEESMALSYLTPALTRRMQKQLLAQLAPSEVRTLHRTLSSRNYHQNGDDFAGKKIANDRRSLDRFPTTRTPSNNGENGKIKLSRSNLPIGKTSTVVSNDNENDFNRGGSNRFLLEPKNYYWKNEKSPDSSVSDSFRRKETSESNNSLSRPSSSNDFGYRYHQKTKKEDNSAPSMTCSTKRRVSRFLRPDFFENPKKEEENNNVTIKEKKEREMETQKVLKEIRDKRKERLSLRKERSSSKESKRDDLNIPEYVNVKKKEVENTVKMPEYVNVIASTTSKENARKSKISRLTRPKSYPTESFSSIEKENSKIGKLKKNKDKNETNEEDKSHKNKLIHSIEKKLEKFRSSPEKIKERSGVENTIRKLREQSLPKNLESCCCTESELIKRAVSVEDISNITEKPLQASRRSVTKILSLFKKYEENEKITKKKNKKKKTDNEDTKLKQQSKLPVNSLRRSLNLEETTNCDDNKRRLTLDLKTSVATPSKKSVILSPTQESKNKTNNVVEKQTESMENNINDEDVRVYTKKTRIPDHAPFRCYSTTEENSRDDSCWSVYSDHVTSSTPSIVNNGNDESVIDRIRRKSFYTRFNENKKPKNNSIGGGARSYRDLDLYKELGAAAGFRTRNRDGYGSLDRKSYDNNNGLSVSRRRTKENDDTSRILNNYVNVGPTNRCSSSSSSTLNVLQDDDAIFSIKRNNNPFSRPSTKYGKSSSARSNNDDDEKIISSLSSNFSDSNRKYTPNQ